MEFLNTIGGYALGLLGAGLAAFMAGIGWGFIGHNIYLATGVVGCATMAAAVCGIYFGYSQGCRLRYVIYGIGGGMLAFVGADILVRYL